MSLRRDTFWTAADALVAAGLAFAFRLFVARILVPEDFGIAAMALTVIILLQVVIDLGFNAALIQKDEERLTQRLIDSTFTASLIISLAIAALTAFVLAPLAAAYYAVPAVEPLVAVAALMLLPNPFSSVASAMMMRARRFKALAIIRCTTTLVSILCAATLLWFKPGPWVMVGQAIAASLFNAVAQQFAAPRRYRLRLHREDLREVFGFSGFVVANDVAAAASANAGVIILGRFASTAEVGLFSLATYIVETIRRTLMSILSRVMLVHYSQAKNDPEQLRSLFLTTLTWNCRLVFPVALSIILFGPSLSVAVLGPEWNEMGPVLGWLSLSVMIVAAGGTTSTLYRAIGRPGLELSIFLATTFSIQLPAMIVGAWLYGLEGVAIAIAASRLIAVITRQVIVNRIIGGVWLGAITRLLQSVVILAPIVLAWAASGWFSPLGWVSEAMWLGAGLAIYGMIELPRAFPDLGRRLSIASWRPVR